MPEIKPTLSVNEAVKIDALVARAMGDIGSIHARISEERADGRVAPMSHELVSMRRYLRELQDAVREIYPHAFFK